ncbi:MAG: tRNA (adenosine(37)-N6)-threonylcarbamoyltransferase complex dimerization subunit type 1 TsaB [Deltaproteobacteria bacterium RIFOXYD12_FULL_57_12]|nr:MAG: tRNA (adenosine(37)-N6)-threonylcarbamoyltransferase complex dimerization subunit type 1 TsaB [Deltaproteobacteria bacterium RIFOXYD12_FULL_57_12]
MAPPESQRLPRATPVLLALETATTFGSVALVAGDRCVAEYSLQSPLTHSRRLLAGVEWIMQESGSRWEDIDGIAVSLGPGSFTGLRIGLSTVKGLVLATGKPLLGVGTLDGLAGQFRQACHLVCPVLDARKKEVYTAFYRSDAHGVCQRLSEYLVLPPEAFCAMLTEPVILVGDGAEVYGELFQERLAGRVSIAPASIYFPRAAAIGMLAVAKWRRQEFLDASTTVPVYIRPSEAELLFPKAGSPSG